MPYPPYSDWERTQTGSWDLDLWGHPIRRATAGPDAIRNPRSGEWISIEGNRPGFWNTRYEQGSPVQEWIAANPYSGQYFAQEDGAWYPYGGQFIFGSRSGRARPMAPGPVPAGSSTPVSMQDILDVIGGQKRKSQMPFDLPADLEPYATGTYRQP